MCEPGAQVLMKSRGRLVSIDSCISGIVAALNAAGIETLASCCGHGKRAGLIALAAGPTRRRRLLSLQGSVRGILPEPNRGRFLLRVLPEALGYRETPRVSDAIADRFGAGDSIAELAADYDITPEAAEACVRVERQADAAIVEAAENLEHHPMSPGAMLRLLETVRAKRSALNK